MRLFPLVIFTFAALLLVGCITPGQRLEPHLVHLVKEGSSQREVEKLIGKPNYTVTSSGDSSVAHYEFVRRNDSAQRLLFGNLASEPGDILLRHLSILYNEKSIAEKVLFYQSVTPFRTGIGKASAGTVVHPEALKQITKGFSTEKSLMRQFGEPQLKTLDTKGNVVLEWYYAKAEMGFLRNKNDMQVLSVVLDQSGRVVDHALSDSSSR